MRLSSPSTKAEFISVQKCKVYNAHQDIDLSSCKELLQFDNSNFISAEFLVDRNTLGGGLLKRIQMKIFLRFVGDPGFQSGIVEDIGVHHSTVNKMVNCKVVNGE